MCYSPKSIASSMNLMGELKVARYLLEYGHQCARTGLYEVQYQYLTKSHLSTSIQCHNCLGTYFVHTQLHPKSTALNTFEQVDAVKVKEVYQCPNIPLIHHNLVNKLSQFPRCLIVTSFNNTTKPLARYRMHSIIKRGPFVKQFSDLQGYYCRGRN